jgi:hypothetical protein
MNTVQEGLVYRVLVANNPVALVGQMNEAVTKDYKLYGAIQQASKPRQQVANRIPMFVQLACLRGVSVNLGDGCLVSSDFDSVVGIISQDSKFSAEVSSRIETEGWGLYGLPMLYVEDRSFRIAQILIRHSRLA